MRTLALCLIALAAPGAFADEADTWYPGGAETEFARVTTTLKVGGVAREFERSLFSFDYSEAATSWLHLGITVGLSFDAAQDEPLVGDSEPAGYLFGVFAGARLFQSGGFAADAELRYVGDYAEGDASGDTTKLRLDETVARLALSYRFTTVELSGGAYAYAASGEVERSGVLIGKADLEEVDSGGAFGAVRLRTDGGFGLGLRAETGARESIAFVFSSTF